LRIFNAIEREHEASSAGGFGGRFEKVFDGQRFLGAYESHDALMRGGSGKLRELLAGFLANADSGLAAGGDKAGEAIVVAFAGDENLVKAAAAGLDSFLNRVHAVENFHD
jgi:hypothetical protein